MQQVDLHSRPASPGNMEEDIDNKCYLESRAAEDGGRLGTGIRRFVWTSKLDYRLTLVAYTVGLGNIWRFPYLCHKHGGAAFLLPYLLCVVCVGLPLVFIEVIVGQFSRRGPIGAWGLCPLLRGIGVSQVVLSACAVPYLLVCVTWSLYYLYQSLAPALTWATCGNIWNSPHCHPLTDTPASHNISAMVAPDQFWRNNVLRMSSGLHEFGSLQLHLVLTWLVTCVLIFLCVIKGMRSVGKVAYVTALLPYFLLTVLLIRSAMMEGALSGIVFFLKPDFTQLTHYQVWLDAMLHVFVTMGAGWGAISTLASHNKSNNNPICDASVVVVVGVVTSMLAGCMVFAAFGFTAHKLQISIEHIVIQGPYVSFVVLAEAVSLLAVPQLWAFLLYLLMALLALHSALCVLETVVVSLEDGVSRHFPSSPNLHAMLAALYMVVVFCVGLPFTTSAGLHIYLLVDVFLPLVCPLCLAALELLVISWTYGIRRLCVDIEYLLGRQPSVCVKLVWCILTPALLIITLTAAIFAVHMPTHGDYVWPSYACVVGWCVACAPLLPVPVTLVAEVIRQRGSLCQRLKTSLKPDMNWESSTQRYRGEEYELWCEENTSMLKNASFIFIREKPT